jgi:hypothetical protein
MYRTATVVAYDVMDTVFVTCTVRLYDTLNPGSSEAELTCATTIQGVGSGSSRDWMQDALVGLLEAL